MSDLMQRGFGEEAPAIVNANEPHMACLLLLDTSGSMGGTPIDELNAGINQFKAQVCQDSMTRNILDVAIVEFNSSHQVVQDFVPVEFMEPTSLSARGQTYIVPALKEAIDMVTERSRFYHRSGSQPYKPWIVLISDGLPMDDISGIASEIQQLEDQGKLKFFSLGVGNYDSKTLHQLSGPKVMKLKGYDFSGFFDWLNKSMRSISRSSPNEKAKGVRLPENVDKDTDDWM